MKFKYSVILFVISMFFLACNGNQQPQTVESKAYILSLQKMPFEQLKSQLKKDTALLNKLLRTATFKMELTNHFSSGQKQAVNQSVPEFIINRDQSKITSLFKDYASQLYFNQNFIADKDANRFNLYGQDQFSYKSRFSLTADNHVIEDKEDLFKPYENQVVTSEKAYFFRGKPIAKNAIKLKRIDSIDMDVSLQLPTAFEKFSIDKAAKNATYKDYKIQVESIKGNLAKLKIPLALYQKILDYQAENQQNFRMNTSANSTTPMLEVSAAVRKNLQELHDIFDEVLKDESEKSAKAQLNQINQNHLDAKINMVVFDSYLTKLFDDKEKIKSLGDIGLYNEIANAGKKVIDVETQYVLVEFPDDINKIDVFVASETVPLKKNIMVKFGNYESDRRFFNTEKPNIIFSSGDRNYGISDRNGEIVIKPEYESLEQVGQDYFKSNGKLHWLNLEDKKLVSLPQYKSFLATIKPGYDIFEKTIGDEDRVGVVLNRDKNILPFEYHTIEKHEQFIVASKSLHVDELYDLNFNRLPSNGIQQIAPIDNFIASNIKYPALFVAEDTHKKKALVDKNLKLLTAFKYEFINPFYRVSNYYIVGIRTADGSNYWYGIIDEKGKEVVPFIFCNISEEFDKNGKLKFCLKDKNQAMDFKSFLKTYGK